jgi:hypothetical protein
MTPIHAARRAGAASWARSVRDADLAGRSPAEREAFWAGRANALATRELIVAPRRAERLATRARWHAEGAAAGARWAREGLPLRAARLDVRPPLWRRAFAAAYDAAGGARWRPTGPR